VKSSKGMSPDDTLILPYRPQYEIIAEKIIGFIAHEELKPGDRLPTEQGLGEHLGVSRSVVREAIKYLTATGLVVARKGVGISVAGSLSSGATSTINSTMTVNPEHIQSLFDFRCMQEMLTIRKAIEQITLAEMRELEKIVAANRVAAEAGAWEAFLKSDDAFHLSIARATHNIFLVETIASILHLQRWAIKVVTGGAPGSLLASVEQHEAIFHALRDGLSDVAVQAVNTHIQAVLAAYHQEVRRRLLPVDEDEQRKEQ